MTTHYIDESAHPLAALNFLGTVEACVTAAMRLNLSGVSFLSTTCDATALRRGGTQIAFRSACGE